mmetsp:Transcript_5015/g.12831  ORF Transcript_5015/g.12831 Transcript_5015/m.12831 type:complete len:208 (+) Transcript_5015:688-1311(+)
MPLWMASATWTVLICRFSLLYMVMICIHSPLQLPSASSLAPRLFASLGGAGRVFKVLIIIVVDVIAIVIVHHIVFEVLVFLVAVAVCLCSLSAATSANGAGRRPCRYSGQLRAWLSHLCRRLWLHSRLRRGGGQRRGVRTSGARRSSGTLATRAVGRWAGRFAWGALQRSNEFDRLVKLIRVLEISSTKRHVSPNRLELVDAHPYSP